MNATSTQVGSTDFTVVYNVSILQGDANGPPQYSFAFRDWAGNYLLSAPSNVVVNDVVVGATLCSSNCKSRAAVYVHTWLLCWQPMHCSEAWLLMLGADTAVVRTYLLADTAAPAVLTFTPSVAAGTRVQAPATLLYSVAASEAVTSASMTAWSDVHGAVSAATVTRPAGQPQVAHSRRSTACDREYVRLKVPRLWCWLCCVACVRSRT